MSEVQRSNPGRNILVTISNVLSNHSTLGLTVYVLICSRRKLVLHFCNFCNYFKKILFNWGYPLI